MTSPDRPRPRVSPLELENFIVSGRTMPSSYSDWMDVCKDLRDSRREVAELREELAGADKLNKSLAERADRMGAEMSAERDAHLAAEKKVEAEVAREVAELRGALEQVEQSRTNRRMICVVCQWNGINPHSEECPVGRALAAVSSFTRKPGIEWPPTQNEKSLLGEQPQGGEPSPNLAHVHDPRSSPAVGGGPLPVAELVRRLRELKRYLIDDDFHPQGAAPVLLDAAADMLEKLAAGADALREALEAEQAIWDHFDGCVECCACSDCGLSENECSCESAGCSTGSCDVYGALFDRAEELRLKVLGRAL